MARFAEVLTEIFPSREFGTPFEVEGVWEPLQTDFADPNWGAIWPHALDEDFADCVRGVKFDDQYLMNIVISRPKSSWHGHQLRVDKGREYQRIVVAARKTEAGVQEACAAVVNGISQTCRGWKTCEHCGDSQPPVYI